MDHTFESIFEQIVSEFEEVKRDHDKASAKGNKSAARRTRTGLSKIGKLISQYRKASLSKFSE